MELTREETIKRRLSNDPFYGLVYIVYDVTLNTLEKIYRDINEAYAFTKTRPDLKLVNISNSIHCPRHIYLELTPYAQLDFFLDGYLSDDITLKHEKLRMSRLYHN
jgi:hypothetical protein